MKSILQLRDVIPFLVFVRVLPLGQEVVEGRTFQVLQVVMGLQLLLVFLLELLVRIVRDIFFSLESFDSVSG